MPAHGRQLKVITFTLGSTEFQCQVRQFQLDPGIPDGERMYTMCPDGVVVDDGIPEPTLSLTFFADWRSEGISDYLWENTGEDAAFELVLRPDIPAETVKWTGTVRLKAPPVGGEARTQEVTEVTLQCVGEPVYSRVGA
jgi:hypothetical protein